MSNCCNQASAAASCCSSSSASKRFSLSTAESLAWLQKAKEQGHPVVGILCEYTPRELIAAAGAIPVCLCGGSAATIPAAEQRLPSNLCPLVKSTYGYHLERSSPYLEMADLIVAETTCDAKKKMYELMSETRAMHVMELPQKPDDPDAFEHWVRELQKLRDRMEQQFAVRITDEALRHCIRLGNQRRSLRRQLANLMQSDQPPLTGREMLEFRRSVNRDPQDLKDYEKALADLSTPSTKSTQSAKRRVLLTGVPVPEGAERVVDIIEDCGGLIVAMENCSGLKPIMEDIDETATDPLRALAAKYFHLPCSVMTPNTRRLDLLRTLARDFRPDCIIELVWQACLTYDVESEQIKRLAEDELHLPYLKIGTDYSQADSARIAVRVEALYEMALSI